MTPCLVNKFPQLLAILDRHIHCCQTEFQNLNYKHDSVVWQRGHTFPQAELSVQQQLLVHYYPNHFIILRNKGNILYTKKVSI